MGRKIENALTREPTWKHCTIAYSLIEIDIEIKVRLPAN